MRLICVTVAKTQCKSIEIYLNMEEGVEQKSTMFPLAYVKGTIVVGKRERERETLWEWC